MKCWIAPFLLCVSLSPHKGYDILSTNKPAWQSSYYSLKWPSSNAVDGNIKNRNIGGPTTSCIHTAIDGAENAFWGVNLTKIVSIHDIKIYYRYENIDNYEHESRGRFAGFFLYVSNTTNIKDGYLCYHEIQNDTNSPPSEITLDCQVYGQYVIFYNERRPTVVYPSYYSSSPIIELCELQVYGCPGHKYGKGCQYSCPIACQQQRCNITTGECLSCINGYQGASCSEECANRTYGFGCKEHCGNCVDGGGCNHITGHCEHGCDSGWLGDFCNQSCEEGKFGKDCKQMCSVNCYDQKPCNNVDGSCFDGCKAGWMPNRCTEECSGNTYGENCKNICGHCLDSKCDPVSGKCIMGCKTGFKGNICDKNCDKHTYGKDCSFNCSTDCLNRTCNSQTGKCFQVLLKTDGSQQSSGNMTLIVILCISVVFICIVITVIAVFIMRRRNIKNSKDSINTHLSSDEKTYYNIGHNQYENASQMPSLYQNVDGHTKNNTAESHNDKISTNGYDELEDEHEIGTPEYSEYIYTTIGKSVRIEKLSNAILEKSKDENKLFTQEYKSLPYGEHFCCDVGKLETNLPKNRFKTTFPYDHSRVILQSVENTSDYINANYISDCREEKFYIAAQGPKSNTLVDFWRMVWQEEICVIVMLTNLTEGIKKKCAMYWPEEGETAQYSRYKIRNLEEKKYAFYIIRKFDICFQQKTRGVFQMQYTAWPDHGTPDELSLVVFHDHVTRIVTKIPTKAPLLVHCSAGIGRTGTFIALDALLKEGKVTGKVNIPEFVRIMRKDRMSMVQTEEQYVTIHKSLLEAIRAPCYTTGRTEFVGSRTSSDNSLKDEHQTLLHLRQVYTEKDYAISRQNMNFEDPDVILPLDRYSLHLPHTNLKSRTYINATTVPSFTNKEGFIITPYPSDDTIVDFLRLITEYESVTVVAMDPIRNTNALKLLIPEISAKSTVEFFEVICDNVTLKGDHVSHINLKLRKKSDDELKEVSIYEPRSEIKETDRHALRTVSELVMCTSQQSEEHPITIMSSDGARLCGVFCAVYNALQEISMDDEIDLFTIVRQLQVRRPQLCSSLDEYRMCYDVVLNCIKYKDESTYYNI